MYVTYGLGNKFIPEMLEIDLHSRCGKPNNAWWGSPINAEFGWKEWCLREEFVPEDRVENYFSDSNRILWELSEKAKKLDIKTEQDMKNLKKSGYIYRTDSIFYNNFDFYQMVLDGYDAIELYDPWLGHGYCEDITLCMILNGWDCESIAVLNPKVIIQKEEE